MKNHARNAVMALLALMLILSITRFAKAAGPSINLPPGTVNATYHYPGSNSYWTITLSNVPSGYDVTNGAYTGWCNDETHYINNGETLVDVTLYSSYEQSVYPGDWNRVNYIINHPQGIWQDVQDAIWHYIDGHTMPSSAAGIAMVNDADAYGGGFEPAPGQLLAVVVWKAGYQTTFIAVIVPAQLTVNNGGHGAASGQGSYPAGTPATFGITPTTVSGGTGVQYVFIGWTSSDLGGYTGASSSSTVTMSNSITETAIWQTQYWLTVTSPYDTTGGGGWYPSDSTAHATLSSGGPISGGTGTRYVFTSWSDDASGTGLTSAGITMSAPKTATAVWTTQFYLTVLTSPLGIGTIGGAGWYNQGEGAPLTAPINLGGYRLIKVPFSWDVDGGSQGIATSITVTMNAPHTATAHYSNLPVGGEWVPIDKVQLLAPWTCWALFATVIAVAFVFVKRKRKQQS
jgi:uncharacterized repeat protein (TIGR02543 family)